MQNHARQEKESVLQKFHTLLTEWTKKSNFRGKRHRKNMKSQKFEFQTTSHENSLEKFEAEHPNFIRYAVLPSFQRAQDACNRTVSF